MDRTIGFAIRRVRLLTILALVAVPWLILSYEFSWRETAIAAAVLVLLATVCGGW